MKNIVTFASENQLTGLKSECVMIDDSNFTTENLEELLDQIEAQSPTPPPCRYTKEEVVQRVLQATADVEAGRGLMSLEDFEKRVRSWYN